ncbi:MAG: YicC family protein [Bacteroidales bacterium]|nr:YicC family protein [Bacteroidales bacterium]
MIRSMTGYGIAEQTYNSKKIVVEVKTLNSKQLDLQVKLPNELRSAELDYRNQIGNKLQRGKIDATITITDTDLAQTYHIDQDIVKAYKSQIEAISGQLGIAPAVDEANILFRMPGIFNVPVENYDEAFVAKVGETLDQALDMVDGFRIQEGQTLKKDLLHRVELILNLLEQVEPYEKSRHEVIKQRLTKNLAELATAGQYDENRFEQELIYYLEKLDITEEKVRLRQHCNYFNESCDDDQAGKKLGFIAQEMGREINTLGSKANEVNIQKLVVQMKDELEKIKEQVCNIL